MHPLDDVNLLHPGGERPERPDPTASCTCTTSLQEVHPRLDCTLWRERSACELRRDVEHLLLQPLLTLPARIPTDQGRAQANPQRLRSSSASFLPPALAHHALEAAYAPRVVVLAKRLQRLCPAVCTLSCSSSGTTAPRHVDHLLPGLGLERPGRCGDARDGQVRVAPEDLNTRLRDVPRCRVLVCVALAFTPGQAQERQGTRWQQHAMHTRIGGRTRSVRGHLIHGTCYVLQCSQER